MSTITNWAGIALLSLAPIMASAQGQPVTPFNNASVIPNNAVTLPMGPNQVGTLLSITDVSASIGGIGSFSIVPLDGLKLGMGVIGSSTITYKGAKTNSLTPIIGAKYNTKIGEFSVGAKLPFTGKNKSLEAGQLSALLLYTRQFGTCTGKFSGEFGFGSQNFGKSANLTWELVKVGTGVSANLRLTDKAKAKLSAGIEQSLGKGWQFGASIHPEKNFFKGKLNPSFGITKLYPFGRVTGQYSPQTKSFSGTVRLNY